MDEPKRRMRRAQMENSAQQETPIQPDAQVLQEEAPPVPEASVHRRRRVQADQIVLPQPEQDKDSIHLQLDETQTPEPVYRPRKKKEHRSHKLKQMAINAAAQLGMMGFAIVRAAKRIKREHLRLAAMALCTCVALVSAWQVGGIMLRSIRTHRLNDELSRQRAAIMETQQEMTEEVPDSVQAEQTPALVPESVQESAAEPTVESAPAAQQETAAPIATAVPDIVKSTKYRRLGGDALPEMAQLHQENRDLVAWIQIPDVLDLPIVYRDNDYYLTRDFSKQKNASGTIFLDVNHPFKEKTQNLLLHGHNMKDGTMFGRLAQYLYDSTYLRNHPFISFDTLWDKEQYVIFAVLNVSLKPADPRFFNYFTHDTFVSDAEFTMYIRQLQLRSEYAIPIDVEPSDALLTLSTCLDEDRLVIVARRLREGETRSELRTLIRMATKQ